jgi:hypothetical protein|tara:strand:- start:88 stop:450 length:363 start_codon:yes stop_codon:yes gene_type:complete
MIRCETCLIALQIADREDNNCPDCKDYKGNIIMILITMQHQVGDYEFNSYHYRVNLTEKEYYDSDTLEETLVKEIWQGEITGYDEDNESWWRDTTLVSIGLVQDLSPTRFKTLKELSILY